MTTTIWRNAILVSNKLDVYASAHNEYGGVEKTKMSKPESIDFRRRKDMFFKSCLDILRPNVPSMLNDPKDSFTKFECKLSDDLFRAEKIAERFRSNIWPVSCIIQTSKSCSMTSNMWSGKLNIPIIRCSSDTLHVDEGEDGDDESANNQKEEHDPQKMDNHDLYRFLSERIMDDVQNMPEYIGEYFGEDNNSAQAKMISKICHITNCAPNTMQSMFDNMDHMRMRRNTSTDECCFVIIVVPSSIIRKFIQLQKFNSLDVFGASGLSVKRVVPTSNVRSENGRSNDGLYSSSDGNDADAAATDSSSSMMIKNNLNSNLSEGIVASVLACFYGEKNVVLEPSFDIFYNIHVHHIFSLGESIKFTRQSLRWSSYFNNQPLLNSSSSSISNSSNTSSSSSSSSTSSTATTTDNFVISQFRHVDHSSSSSLNFVCVPLGEHICRSIKAHRKHGDLLSSSKWVSYPRSSSSSINIIQSQEEVVWNNNGDDEEINNNTSFPNEENEKKMISTKSGGGGGKNHKNIIAQKIVNLISHLNIVDESTFECSLPTNIKQISNSMDEVETSVTTTLDDTNPIPYSHQHSSTIISSGIETHPGEVVVDLTLSSEVLKENDYSHTSTTIDLSATKSIAPAESNTILNNSSQSSILPDSVGNPIAKKDIVRIMSFLAPLYAGDPNVTHSENNNNNNGAEDTNLAVNGTTTTTTTTTTSIISPSPSNSSLAMRKAKLPPMKITKIESSPNIRDRYTTATNGSYNGDGGNDFQIDPTTIATETITPNGDISHSVLTAGIRSRDRFAARRRLRVGTEIIANQTTLPQSSPSNTILEVAAEHQQKYPVSSSAPIPSISTRRTKDVMTVNNTKLESHSPSPASIIKTPKKVKIAEDEKANAIVVVEEDKSKTKKKKYDVKQVVEDGKSKKNNSDTHTKKKREEEDKEKKKKDKDKKYKMKHKKNKRKHAHDSSTEEDSSDESSTTAEESSSSETTTESSSSSGSNGSSSSSDESSSVEDDKRRKRKSKSGGSEKYHNGDKKSTKRSKKDKNTTAPHEKKKSNGGEDSKVEEKEKKSRKSRSKSRKHKSSSSKERRRKESANVEKDGQISQAVNAMTDVLVDATSVLFGGYEEDNVDNKKDKNNKDSNKQKKKKEAVVKKDGGNKKSKSKSSGKKRSTRKDKRDETSSYSSSYSSSIDLSGSKSSSYYSDESPSSSSFSENSSTDSTTNTSSSDDVSSSSSSSSASDSSSAHKKRRKNKKKSPNSRRKHNDKSKKMEKVKKSSSKTKEGDRKDKKAAKSSKSDTKITIENAELEDSIISVSTKPLVESSRSDVFTSPHQSSYSKRRRKLKIIPFKITISSLSILEKRKRPNKAKLCLNKSLYNALQSKSQEMLSRLNHKYDKKKRSEDSSGNEEDVPKKKSTADKQAIAVASSSSTSNNTSSVSGTAASTTNSGAEKPTGADSNEKKNNETNDAGQKKKEEEKKKKDSAAAAAKKAPSSAKKNHTKKGGGNGKIKSRRKR